MLSIAQPDPEIFARSLDAARRAIELDPDSAEGHTACAFASSPDNYDESKKHFEIAMRINPDLYDTYYFYGRAAFANSDYDRSAEMFEKASEVDPNEYQGAGLAITAYHAAGQSDRAQLAAARALERVRRHVALNPDDARALCLGSNMLAEQGRVEEALEWAERALAISPDDVGTLYNTACVFSMVGDKERALANLTRAVDLGWAMRAWIVNDPDFDGIRDTLPPGPFPAPRWPLLPLGRAARA
jgi:tetratricopeptide (TPR) repeat protein